MAAARCLARALLGALAPLLLPALVNGLSLNASRQIPPEVVAVEDYLRKQHAALRESSTCLPKMQEQVRSLGFDIDPSTWIDKHVSAPARLFVVGDSVAGDLLSLGKPGLACSSARPCDGEGPFQGDGEATWEADLSTTQEHANEGWLHLKRYRLRSSQNTPMDAEAFEIAPAVINDVDRIGESVNMLKGFLSSAQATEDDVLVVGMLGNDFESRIAAFDKYSSLIMKEVVDQFPGRVVVLGGSPQHFKTGRSGMEDDEASCAPAPLPGDQDPPMNDFRHAVWTYNNWKFNNNKRSRFVDIFEMLLPLWECHRRADDCLHWGDTVVSLTVYTILNALAKLKSAD